MNYFPSAIIFLAFSLCAPRVAANDLVSIADLHGDFDHTIKILQKAGLVEEVIPDSGKVRCEDGRAFSRYQGVRWIGGNTTLVQTGDIVDRGTHARDLYALFHDLRMQANESGGRVVNLLGNHELMNLYDELHYVSAADIQEFGGKAARDAAFAPDGWVGRDLAEEFQTAFISHGILFVHAGLRPEDITNGVDALNEDVRRSLLSRTSNPVFGESGPFWLRRFALGPEEMVCPELFKTLHATGAVRMVVGHTQVNGVQFRCGGRIVLADTIISKSGYPECWSRSSLKNFGCRASLSHIKFKGQAGLAEVHETQSDTMTTSEWHIPLV